ncbi:MAG: B12-binding domain-containing radical SAM protein [Myxococcales bacterium]
MRRLRLKLISLPWELEFPTLSLASLAAVTPPQFDVAIVDLLRERLYFDEDVDLVGITASTPRIKAAYALADLYRTRGVKVVIGGHHATAMPEEALGHADAVVCGEGETSWIRICDAFLSDRSRVQGIYRDLAPDLATLPPPRVELMHIERYGAYNYPIIASRGCPEACSFCFAKRMTHGFRTYPISHVLEQIRRRPPSTRALYFVDDNLPADLDYARELFKALERDRVPFGIQARIEFSQNPEDLALAHRAGCLLISSGYESINQLSLDGTGKRAQADDYRVAIENIFREGILPSGNWMFGFDWDTPDVFARTLDFLDSARLYHCSFTAEIPFPGTAAWKRYRNEGRLLTEDYDDYVGKDHVVVRPKQLTPEQLRDGIRWLGRQFYSPKRATLRAIRGLPNHKLRETFKPAWFSPFALLGLNYYQVWQWHYRFVPSLQWLYQRMVSVNKYRYFRDALAGTNFTRNLSRPAVALPTRRDEGNAAWVHAASGHKPSRAALLSPTSGLVEQPHARDPAGTG